VRRSPMALPPGRLVFKLDREGRRILDVDDVYFVEAERSSTVVRLRGSRPIRDVRSLSELMPVLKRVGFVRIHRSYAVNLSRVSELRRQRDGVDWEVKLEPPVNRVLPVSRGELPKLLDVLDGA
jgi:DNA-binding LytR/AlgR family response regulator